MSKRKDAGWSVFRRGGGDGRHVLAYQPEPGVWKQHSLGFHVDDAAAEREARTWLAQRKAEGSLPSATKPIAELARKWLVLRAANPNLAGSTVVDNRDQFKNHITPRFGALPVGQLTATMVRDWVRETRGSMSPSRVRNIVNTLSAFYEDARAEGWVKSSENVVRHPSVKKEIPSAGNVREEVVTVSLDAAQRLIGDSRITSHRRIRYALGFLTGMRDGEIAGLTWADVATDEAPPCIRVRRAHALRSQEGKHAASADPKTNESKRKVPIHPALAEALKWWRDEGVEMFVGKVPEDGDPIIPSPRTGKAWRPKSARDVRDDLETLGLPTETPDGTAVDFHATRRSFHTWLGEAGVDEPTKAQIMGHVAKTTGGKHYTGPLLRRMAAAIETVPLRWGVAFLPDAGTVPAPFDGDPHSALPVRAHSEASQGGQKQNDSDTCHLSSAVEQRFRKSSPGTPEETKTPQESADTGRVGAQGNDLGATFAQAEARAATFRRKPRRQHKAAEWARLDSEAAGMIVEMVDLSIAGRTTLSETARSELVYATLAKTVAVLDRRDRVRR